MLTLILIGLVGGLITGISPCVLPVLPVIFLSSGASGDQRPSGRRPLLVVLGLTLSFSVFTVLGSLVLRALPLPQDIIRWAGIVILVLLGVGMIVPRFEGSRSVLLAVSILGATIMPHAIYAHSALARDRFEKNAADVAAALNDDSLPRGCYRPQHASALRRSREE